MPADSAEVANDIEFIAGDIRDAAVVDRAAQSMEEVHHLAYVNRTQFFYTQPDLVLDVGVRGMVNVIDACRKHRIGTLGARIEFGGLSDSAANPATKALRSQSPIL